MIEKFSNFQSRLYFAYYTLYYAKSSVQERKKKSGKRTVK